MKAPQRNQLILIGLSLVLCFRGMMWGLPSSFDPAQDSVVPMGALADVGLNFEEITAYRYPPFHFHLLQIAFLPVRAFMAMQPLSDKVRATLFILTARLVSVAMAIGVLLFLRATARRLWGERAGFFAALVFLLAPATLYYAKNANLDIPYIFWLSAALFFYVRILCSEARRYDYLWLGLTASLAVCTKDQAYGFLLLMPLPVMLQLYRANEQPKRERWIKLAQAAGAFFVVFIIIHNILFDFESFRLHVSTILGPASEGWRTFRAGPVGQLRLLTESILRLMDAWTIAGVALAVIGIVFAFRAGNRLRWALLLPAIGYYLSFLAVVGYVEPRFLMPVMLPLALFAGLGISRLWDHHAAGRITAIVLIVLTGLGGLALDQVLADDPRRDAQAWMIDNVAPEAIIYFAGDIRDMPPLNRPYDPRAVEGTVNAIAAARPKPDLLIMSIPANEPGGPQSILPAVLIRRNLGNWGRTKTEGGKTLYERLTGKDASFIVAARFESSIAPLVPAIAESANRGILFLTPAPHSR